MTYRRISEDAIRLAQVEGNLPNKPNQSTIYGGRAMNAAEVKASFDRLPKLIIEYFNAFVDAVPEGISGDILTGIAEGHTLKDLFGDIESSALARYLKVDGDTTLSRFYEDVVSRVTVISDRVPTEAEEGAKGKIYAVVKDGAVDSLFIRTDEGWAEIKMKAEGLPFLPGNGIRYDAASGILSVETADTAEKDNTLPITSAAVYTELGNIAAILETI